VSTGRFLGQQRERVDTGDEILINQFITIKNGTIGSANIALVGDNSYFRLTGPVAGQRFRLSVERSFGIYNFTGLLADYRKYLRFGRFTFAARGLSYLRFEEEVNSVFPLFVGNMGFVRGFEIFDINPERQLEQFFGSKMGLVSLELRVPFTGPKQLSLIKSNVLFSDLSLFFDAGVSFDEFSHFSDGEPVRVGIPQPDGSILEQTVALKPEIARSVGVSMRVNLFGALIVEPYWAFPLESNSSVRFGLNFIPGW